MVISSFGRRRHRRFECHHQVNNHACHELMKGVWQLDWNSQTTSDGVRVPPDPYMRHWENCILSTEEYEALRLEDRAVVISLVELIKQRLNQDITQIKAAICAHYSSVVLSDQQAEEALKFAIRLWLHTSPNLSNGGSSSFRTVVSQNLPERSDPSAISGRLSDDFCAKSLWRKGGVRIHWTDDIEQHLTLYKDQSLNVFRNSSMLRALQQDPARDPFPNGFVHETLQTLYLLFRPLEPKHARRNVRYMEKHLDADLELAMADYENVDLYHYPYWHERLAKIQHAYDKKTPTSVVQWWYDRRDRVQWATFWIAFIVFVLSVVFGIISSVTAIWQVRLAYSS